jgi:hypothetical protein
MAAPVGCWRLRACRRSPLAELTRQLATVQDSTLQQCDELPYHVLLAAYPSKREQDS